MKAPFDLKNIPTKPGIYQYLDSEHNIIYIGKAKNLRKRVTSYFSKEHYDKTALLVARIKDIKIIVTPSEIEALLLEAQLIRKHQPKYNIDLKNNIRYAWIVLTNETFPRLLTTRNKTIDGEYFGPFVQGQHRRNLIIELQKRFFIRTCRVLPKKACLRYHIGICKAPCIKAQTREDYMNEVEKVRKYLQGKNKELIKELTVEMQTYSDKEAYEQAKNCKEQIESLEYLQEQLLVQQNREHEEDVINYVIERKHDEPLMRLQVFSYRTGVLQGTQTFRVAHTLNAFDEFLKRYYEVMPVPRTIIVPEQPEDTTLAKYLSRDISYTVKFEVPKQGIKKQLLELVTENLRAQASATERLAHELQELLSLDKPIYTIETFDISHHSGTSMVGSMVHFKNGKPLKSKYRRFKIQTVVNTVDDFRAMKEVVGRKYLRVKEGKDVAPDLIVIDGGAIQVQFALEALEELGLKIPLVGLAKKFEEIYYPGKATGEQYDKKSDAMKTIIQGRDEAHRFGIAYHRLLKSKKTLEKD